MMKVLIASIVSFVRKFIAFTTMLHPLILKNATSHYQHCSLVGSVQVSPSNHISVIGM